MVRFESGKNQGPPAKPYVYDKTYTSFWDAVLQEQQQQQQPGGNSNDTSFEKSDIPLKKKKSTTISTDNNTTDNTSTDNTTSTSTKSKMMMHDDDRSEHKEEEQALSSSTPSPLKTPPRTVETTLARTKALLEAHAAAASNDTTTCTSTSTSSPSKEEEEVPSDESKADSQQRIQQQLAVHDSSSVSVHVPDVVVKTTPAPSVVKTLSASPTESPTYTCSEESVDTETHLSPSLITSPAIETADKKDAIQHLMAQVVLDAAKKELEARKKQQPVEPTTPQLEAEEEEHTTTTPTPQQEDTPPPTTLESTLQMPMDAEALAKAQAQLMEQAKSLAKAQALLEAQAKQLARQQELQQLTMETSSPLKPKIQVEEIPRQAPLPTLTKPSAFRAPSDECRISASSSSRLVAAFNSPAITTTVTRMSSSDVHSSTDTVPTANTKTLARLSSNDLNSSIDSIPDDEVPHIPKQRNNKTMPDSDEINAAMDGDWLSRARSEAKAKAQALLQAAQVEATARAKEAQALIQAAQAEAAARAQARADAKAAALAQEKARQKAEIEAQLQAKAVRDAWDFEQMRAQVQMEERIKSKLRASAKAEAEAKLRYKAELDAVAVQKQHMAAARAQADIGKLRQLAKEQAEAKLRRKAEEDAKLVQQQQDAIAAAQATARRKRQEVEEARLAAKVEVERKIQLKAEIDAQKWAAAEARAKQEAERRALAAATAKVRARHSKELQLPTQLSAAQRKAKAIAGTTDQQSSPLQPHHAPSPGVPKDFVPFGKSKGEEADGNICLYLQVPGVVHVSEVKVELEDGVLYISRGIVLPGRGLQKYTRSFPFEENLLDTSKISVTLIPTNATADGVSVLKFSLPKVQPTWNVPLSLVDEDASLSASGGRHTTSKDDGSGGDLEDLTDVSLLDAPDDEVHTLHHPSDELRNSSTHAPDDEKAADPEDLQKTYNKDGCRFVELLQLPVAFALENIVATYSEETVTVVGTEGDEERTSFRHVVPMSTQDVDVRQLTGSYDPNVGRLVLKAPLHSSIPKSRRIRVVKKEDSETIIEGVLSQFGDDLSLSTRGSHPQSVCKPSSSNSLKSQARKHGLKLTGNLKFLASKYLRPRRPKKESSRYR